MNNKFYSVAFALVLAGCGRDGGHHDSGPTITVDDLSTGAYTVSTGDTNAPTIGTYYAGASGARLMVLNDAADKITNLYRRKDSGSPWAAVPAPGSNVTITFLRSTAQVSRELVLADFAGNYAVWVSSTVTAKFSVAASGALTAGDTACKLSGNLSSGRMPNTLDLKLDASGCGTTLPATSTGVIAVDSNFAPTAFRILTDNDIVRVDLWGYRE